MIQTELDTKQFGLLLSTVSRQIGFGTSKGLNRIAKKFQYRQRTYQQKVLTIRQKQWWLYGIKIPKGGWATKKKLESEVIWAPPSREGRTKQDIFTRQEYGGLRVPVGDRQYMAIPKEGVPRTGRGLVPKAWRPGALKEKNARTFFVPFKGNAMGMFLRLGRRQKGYTKTPGGARMSLRDDPNVKFLYLMIPKAQVNAVYGFYKNAKFVWDVWGIKYIEDEIVKAFATANPARRI